MKKKGKEFLDFILKHGKIVFPILLVAAVAVTVLVALRAAKKNDEIIEDIASESSSSEEEILAEGPVIPDVELELNAYPEVNELALRYFTARAEGDAQTVSEIWSSVDEMEWIRIEELGKYIDYYESVDVYTKPGPEENSYIAIYYSKVVMKAFPEVAFPGFESAFICTASDGSLYVNCEDVSEEVSDYIRAVILQDDVVDLCNSITVEYNDVCHEHPDALSYFTSMEQEVKASAGEILAAQMVETEEPDDGDSVSSGDSDVEINIPDMELTVMYATATTTVNVRSSDSETADKLGKLQTGKQVLVKEVLINGWTRIDYEGKDGYVKSEYLNITESSGNVTVAGTITTTAAVNVRATPSETGSKLGVVNSGTVLDWISTEDGWAKVIYGGQVGYIKADYVK